MPVVEHKGGNDGDNEEVLNFERIQRRIVSRFVRMLDKVKYRQRADDEEKLH